MGLEDFKSEDEYSIGSVTTRKKIKNVKLEDDDWKHLLYHDPHWATYFANGMEPEEIKAMIQVLDELIEEGRDGVKQNEETTEQIRDVREELVDEYIKEE